MYHDLKVPYFYNSMSSYFFVHHHFLSEKVMVFLKKTCVFFPYQSKILKNTINLPFEHMFPLYIPSISSHVTINFLGKPWDTIKFHHEFQVNGTPPLERSFHSFDLIGTWTGSARWKFHGDSWDHSGSIVGEYIGNNGKIGSNIPIIMENYGDWRDNRDLRTNFHGKLSGRGICFDTRFGPTKQRWNNWWSVQRPKVLRLWWCGIQVVPCAGFVGFISEFCGVLIGFCGFNLGSHTNIVQQEPNKQPWQPCKFPIGS